MQQSFLFILFGQQTSEPATKLERCMCRELRSWSVNYSGKFSPVMVLSHDYTHELFRQNWRCHKCDSRVNTTGPNGLACIPQYIQDQLPVTFFYRSAVSHSLRKFVRRNAQ